MDDPILVCITTPNCCVNAHRYLNWCLHTAGKKDWQLLDSIMVNLDVLPQLLEVAIVSCSSEKPPVVGLVVWRVRFIKKLSDISPYVRIKEHRDGKPFLGLIHHNTVFNPTVLVVAPHLEDGTHIDHKRLLARLHCYPLSVLPLHLHAHGLPHSRQQT
jgi:hypothetical protein